MKTNIQPTQRRKNRKGFTLVELLVVIAIIASLAGLSYGPIMKHLDSAAKTEAISNGKGIQAAMLGYMTSNGEFPFLTTAVPEDAFNKLFKGGNIGEKKYFWNKANAKEGYADRTKPIETGKAVDKVLASNENVWGYVNGVATSDGHLPLIFDASTGAGAFDVAVWDGKAIIVKVDGSCAAYTIQSGGTVTTDPNFDDTDPSASATAPDNLFDFTNETGVTALPTSPST